MATTLYSTSPLVDVDIEKLTRDLALAGCFVASITPGPQGAELRTVVVFLTNLDAGHQTTAQGIIDAHTTSKTPNATVITGDLTVDNNLDVEGTQTILHTNTVDIEDNLISVDHGVTQPALVVSGIDVERGGGIHTSAQLIYDERTGQTIGWKLRTGTDNSVPANYQTLLTDVNLTTTPISRSQIDAGNPLALLFNDSVTGRISESPNIVWNESAKQFVITPALLGDASFIINGNGFVECGTRFSGIHFDVTNTQLEIFEDTQLKLYTSSNNSLTVNNVNGFHFTANNGIKLSSPSDTVNVLTDANNFTLGSSLRTAGITWHGGPTPATSIVDNLSIYLQIGNAVGPYSPTLYLTGTSGGVQIYSDGGTEVARFINSECSIMHDVINLKSAGGTGRLAINNTQTVAYSPSAASYVAVANGTVTTQSTNVFASLCNAFTQNDSGGNELFSCYSNGAATGALRLHNYFAIRSKTNGVVGETEFDLIYGNTDNYTTISTHTSCGIYFKSSGTTMWYFDPSFNFMPNSNGSLNLGGPSNYLNNGYVNNLYSNYINPASGTDLHLTASGTINVSATFIQAFNADISGANLYAVATDGSVNISGPHFPWSVSVGQVGSGYVDDLVFSYAGTPKARLSNVDGTFHTI